MKKVLLSLSMLAAMMTANAQSIEVGKGAYDDFATVGNSVDNPTGEYSQAFGAQTGGIFWYTDAAYASTYTKTRANGEMAIAINKDVEYSVFGLGFGDDNGATAGGNSFTIDATGATTFSCKIKSTSAVTVKVQFEDINGKKAEANATKTEYAKSVTTAYTTWTVDFNGGIGLDWADATCPANKPCAITGFDASKISKVNFLVSGGAPYIGTVTMDDFKIGKTAYVGLKTIESANIGSTLVFPNPAENSFTAQVNLKSSANVSINVSDMMGNVVRTEVLGNVVSASKEINVSGLAKGMYTVTYILDGTPAKAEKIMVK